MRVQHPANCPEHWDPTEHPDHTSLVGDRVRQILTELARVDGLVHEVTEVNRYPDRIVLNVREVKTPRELVQR
jgi:hypothetical protein